MKLVIDVDAGREQCNTCRFWDLLQTGGVPVYECDLFECVLCSSEDSDDSPLRCAECLKREVS